MVKLIIRVVANTFLFIVMLQQMVHGFIKGVLQYYNDN